VTDPTAALIRDLERTDRLRPLPLRQAIEALELRPGTRLLDIGCGIGLQALQLAEATQPHSHVIGLDISHGVLEHALKKIALLAGIDQILLTAGDMRRLPFASDSFDLCWSVDCLGYPAADHLPLLQEVVRVARDGATVALLSWSSQTLLPGHAMLEARLNATASPYAPYLSQAAPEQHFMRLGRCFPLAGIRGLCCRSFIGEIAAPLDENMHLALTALFEMLWGGALAGASAPDQRAYERLCQQGSPDSILALPDYCAFFTYTMFSGVVQK